MTPRPHPDLVAEAVFVRTPTWSDDLWRTLNTHAKALYHHTDASLQAVHAALWDALTTHFRDPLAREALYLASPSLLTSLTAAEARGLRDWDHLGPALLRYCTRMTTRCTPFGLFAGVARGALAPDTRLTLAPTTTLRRHARVDSHLLHALIHHIHSAPGVLPHLEIQPNSTLTAGPGGHRFIAATLAATTVAFALKRVESDDILDTLLAAFPTPTPFTSVVAHLVELGADDPDALAYVTTLVDRQIFVPTAAFPVTGEDPLTALHTRCLSIPACAPFLAPLTTLTRTLTDLNTAPPGLDPTAYAALEPPLATLAPTSESRHFVQVDAYPQFSECTLGAAATRDLIAAVDTLRSITTTRAHHILARFKDALLHRYEGQAVPLLTALDPDAGVPLDHRIDPFTLVPDLQAQPPTPPSTLEWTPRDAHLLELLLAAQRSDAAEIHLTPTDLAHLRADPPVELPPMFAAHVQLQTHPDNGHHELLLTQICGPSGLETLGRFCHGSPEIHAEVARLLKLEAAAYPDEDLIEVVHLPAARVGNLISRPVLRELELRYHGSSGAPPDHQIDARDITVAVRDGAVRLYARGRPLRVRMTHAHNFQNSTSPLYRLLGYLRDAEGESHGWSWGPLLTARRLPRVRCGAVILALARWRIAADELTDIRRETGARRIDLFTTLRTERNIPATVRLRRSDGHLCFDLDNPAAVALLLADTRDDPEFVLEEDWPTPGHHPVHAADGTHRAELTVILRRNHPQVHKPAPQPAPAQQFHPGSPWLFLKLYLPHTAVEPLLTGPLRTFLHAHADVVDRWFFLRYADPEPHLRLRLHGDQAALTTTVLPALLTLLAADPITACWRLQLDTYVREVERYGGPAAIDLAETIFHRDSERALACLDILADTTPDLRWAAVLAGHDALLRSACQTPEEQRRIAHAARDGYAREFALDQPARLAIGRRHRTALPTSTALLEHQGGDHPTLQRLAALTTEYQRSLHPLFAELRTLDLAVPWQDLLLSLMHMSANRLLPTDCRKHELVLANFLARHHDTRAHRK